MIKTKRKLPSLSFVKKASLFVFIFLTGFFVSGFYYQHKSESNLKLSSFPLLKHKGYTLVYDGRNKVPLWTHEHLTRKDLERHTTRGSVHFCENNQIYPLHRSSLQDYYNTGYDRGHMAAAADHLSSQDALKETFLLTNICPQNKELNRGYWAKLERHIRGLVLENKSVDVVSGPLFLPEEENGVKVIRYPVIGNNNVAVPTHFYKVVQINTGSTAILKAYLVPNQTISNQTPLSTYEVSIEEIEKVSGIIFETPQRKMGGFMARLANSI